MEIKYVNTIKVGELTHDKYMTMYSLNNIFDRDKSASLPRDPKLESPNACFLRDIKHILYALSMIPSFCFP